MPLSLSLSLALGAQQYLTAGGGAAVPVNGDLIEFQLMDASALPSGGNIDGNGYVARMRFKGMAAGLAFDGTKGGMLLFRPGWSTAKVYSTANVVEAIDFIAIHRQPYNQQASVIALAAGSDVDIYVVLGGGWGHIFSGDAVNSVSLSAGFYGTSNAITFTTGAVNSSTRPYPQVIMGHLGTEPWTRVPTGGVRVEAIADHYGARAGQTIAAMDFVLKSGATESVVSTNAMQASTLVTSPYPAQCYAATVVPGSLSDGDADLILRAYPFIGTAIWDSSTTGDAWPTDNLPQGLPVRIDTANNYAPAYAIISGTGVVVGTPAVSLTEPTTATYTQGTTPAYATETTAAAALKAYNTTRGHTDMAGGVIVVPDQKMMAGFTAALSSVATYPVGKGFLRFRGMSGSTKIGTGFTSGGTSKLIHPRTVFENLEIRPGATGATHTVFDAGGTAGAPSTFLAETAYAYVYVKGCVGTGSNDGTNTPIYRCGFRWYVNNNFTAFGSTILSASSANTVGISCVVGSTFDNTGAATVGVANVRIIAGSRTKELRFANSSTGVKPEQKGQMFWWSRVSTHLDSSTTIHIAMGGNSGTAGRGVGPEGVSMHTVLLTRTSPVGTPGTLGTGESPVLQISSDFYTDGSSVRQDQAAVQNILLTYVSGIGSRSNLAYAEATAARVVKELTLRFCALSEINWKPDTTPVAVAANGLRSGNFYTRYGASIIGLVTGDNSAGGGPPGPTSWLGEVLFKASEHNVGYANMVVSDTSFTGSNTGADGDFTPLAKLKNRVPANMHCAPTDLIGNTRLSGGTGASGALERTS